MLSFPLSFYKSKAMVTIPKHYKNLLEAVNSLQKRGYIYNFHYQDSSLQCGEINKKLAAEDLLIAEYYRFEGMSDPEDNSVIYAIESNQGHKGIVIDAYGAYSDENITEFLKNVKIKD
jgi:hypothetical protein